MTTKPVYMWLSRVIVNVFWISTDFFISAGDASPPEDISPAEVQDEPEQEKMVVEEGVSESNEANQV